jgi:hypothetical protein
MRILESPIEKRVCERALEECGVENIKIGKHGWPDRLFIGTFPNMLWVEFKRPGEEPSPLQIHRLGHAEFLGYKTKVIDNVEDGIQAIREMVAASVPKKGGKVSTRTPRRRTIP